MSIEEWARAEAEREYPLPSDLSTTSRTLRLVAREHYANGILHLAERLQSPEAIEAACAGFYNDPDGLTSWERMSKVDPDLAERYRAGQRAALTAALEAITKGGGQ